MVIVQLQRWTKSCRPGVQELSGKCSSRQETRCPCSPDPSDKSETLLKANLFTPDLELTSGSYPRK